MRLFDTLSRSLVELPARPGPVRMYFCGPTVYRRIHIGNARPFVISMWLRRWLERSGYDATLVVNITDVNDKIYDAAPGESARLAADATRWYLEDTDGLGLGRPDHEPRATGTVPEQIALIEELIAGGYAYEIDGDVYFRVARFRDYGSLSNQRPDELEEQEPNPRKDDPRDFALWKASKPGEDTAWVSPWGEGRPGWHIECSAMAEKYLGPAFEIHGGGLDLVFPHHENEIAQSRAAGRDFARIWMHNGMLELGGEEMHKSLGNDVSLRHALDTWGRETLLVFFMSAGWRRPLDFSDEVLEQARAQWKDFREAFRVVPTETTSPSWDELAAVLDDDFSTPEALAVLHRWRSAGQLDLLRRGLEVFGLVPDDVAEAPADVVALAEQRLEARAGRDFTEADRLRDEISTRGWEVQDVESGFRLIPRGA